MWINYGVRVCKDNMLSFDDFCAKIICLDPNNEIILGLINDNQKCFINKKIYITSHTALNILINIYNKAVVNFCASELELLVDFYNFDICLSKQNDYKYQNVVFTCFEIDKIKWFKAKDVCIFLGYKDPNSSVRNVSCNNNKISYGDLRKCSKSVDIYLLNKYFIDCQTIFINGR